MSSARPIEGLSIERTDLISDVAQRLVQALNAETRSRYPDDEPDDKFSLLPEEVAPGRGAFLVAFRGGRPAGCGGVRLLADGDAEIKRMYVVPDARSQGIGGAIVRALEAEARSLGAARLILETGVRQPEAQALYRREGFGPIPPYGEHVNHPLSVCMGKNLLAG
jgi:GNAT superfamily N-acetyltransferase